MSTRSNLHNKAAIDPEYVRVELADPTAAQGSEPVTVLIDGVPGGEAGRTLLASYGTWTISVDLPGAIEQEVVLAGTTPARPILVTIDIEPKADT